MAICLVVVLYFPLPKGPLVVVVVLVAAAATSSSRSLKQPFSKPSELNQGRATCQCVRESVVCATNMYSARLSLFCFLLFLRVRTERVSTVSFKKCKSNLRL